MAIERGTFLISWSHTQPNKKPSTLPSSHFRQRNVLSFLPSFLSSLLPSRRKEEPAGRTGAGTGRLLSPFLPSPRPTPSEGGRRSTSGQAVAARRRSTVRSQFSHSRLRSTGLGPGCGSGGVGGAEIRGCMTGGGILIRWHPGTKSRKMEEGSKECFHVILTSFGFG